MYGSIAEILEQSEKNGKAFWEVVMEADMESRDASRDASRQTMAQMLAVMKAADRAYEGERKSASGLSGGDGKLLEAYNRAGKNLCGEFLGKVMERAIKMGESNACMKRIVAAPTAGSCGVIPAVLLSYEEAFGAPEDELVNALYVAAGNKAEGHKVVALIAFGEVILLTEFLEGKHRFFVRREPGGLTTLRKLFMQEPAEEHEEGNANHNQHNVEPLREARIVERVFDFNNVFFFAGGTGRNFDGHGVGACLDGVTTDDGTHLLRGDQKVAAHEGVERCKPGEFGSAFGHAFGHLFVLHFFDFEAAEVSDKAR